MSSMQVQLQSCEGETFKVDVEIVRCIGVLKNMLEDIELEADEGRTVISLPDVESNILKKIIEWATYHKNDHIIHAGDEQDATAKAMSTWDADFLKLDKFTLLKLILASLRWDIKGLFNITLETFIAMRRRENTEEIREISKIKRFPSDYTPERLEQLLMEKNLLQEILKLL
ncbi:unnamed protein product [Orchesella dallaii]|uniref:SKP1 component POZ domain-containing protein n=1 Tax=Orchesella dallaii TaxID=48710 RepID=A0ABP1RWK9_9HEXA